MRTPLGLGSAVLRDRVLQVLADVAPLLESAPSIRFAGRLDVLVDRDLVDDVVTVVREALTNVAKHLGAGHTWVELTLETGSQELAVTVTDNGVGLGEPTRRSGTGNLTDRAQLRGGSCAFVSPAPGADVATQVRWSVPVS